MPAREEAEEAAHRGQMPGASRIAGALRGLVRQPGAQIGLPQCCKRRQIGLAAEMLRQKSKEARDVRAVSLHRQERAMTLLPEPFEEGLPCLLAGHRVSGRVLRRRRGRGS